MSDFSNTLATPENYFMALIAQTRRKDAKLISRFGPYRVGAEASAELLQALRERWPADHFDELNIAIEALRDRRLWQALGFLSPLRKISFGGRRLCRRNERDITRWLLTVAGQNIGGLRLERDPCGWCDVAVLL